MRMLSVNPVNGKQIRIMKTETHLYKNQKTMIWLRQSPQHYAHPARFSRWYTLVDDFVLAEEWRSVLGSYPSAVVITETSSEAKKWIREKAPRDQQLLFLNKAVLKDYEYAKEEFANIVCLEELAPMFPHVLHNYTNGENPAMTALSVAALFRAQRITGINKAELEDGAVAMYANKLQTAYRLAVHHDISPDPLVLVQQYYIPANAKRAREINRCLVENIKCPYVDEILLLNEEEYTCDILKSPKIKQVRLGRRLSYADVFRTIYETIPDDSIVVFSNSDIYLDETWKDIWTVNLRNVFLALLRYDQDRIYGPRADSQDTWVVHAKSVKERTWDWNSLEFYFGKPGCDNAIAAEMLLKKFVVANPALSLKTIHCHASNLRNYNRFDIVDKYVFLHLNPTGLHDLEPVFDMKSCEKPWLQPSAISPSARCVDETMLKTFKSMVKLDSETPKQEKLYEIQNGFATPNGLVYGYDKLYVGKSGERWASATIGHMTPCIGVQSILSAPLSDADAENPFLYVAHYLSKIFRLNAAGYKGDMWLPRDLPRIQEFLQFFKWEEEIMPVIPRDKDIVGYAPRIALLETMQHIINKEEVEALRSRLKGYIETLVESKRVVIFQDDNVLSSEDTAFLSSRLEENGYQVDVVYPSRSSPGFLLQRILGAAYCISTPKNDSLYWLLPRGARVIDIMPDTSPVSDGVHAAAACSLEYWVSLLPRVKGDAKKTFLADQIMKAL